MPSAAAFNPNAVLSFRLPRCPAPRCAQCKAELRDVRPFRSEQPNGSTHVVECLARCSRCGTKHKGTRRLQVNPQGARFLGQEFTRWTESDERNLRPVAQSLAAGATPTAPTASSPSRVRPVEVVPIKAGARAVGVTRRQRLRKSLLRAAAIAAGCGLVAAALQQWPI